MKNKQLFIHTISFANLYRMFTLLFAIASSNTAYKIKMKDLGITNNLSTFSTITSLLQFCQNVMKVLMVLKEI